MKIERKVKDLEKLMEPSPKTETQSGNDADEGSGQGLWAQIKQFARRSVFGAGNSSFRESLEEVIGEHDDAGDDTNIGVEERSMLLNVLSYGDLRIDDIMVPRVDIVAVDAKTSFGDLVGVFADASHSRLPVYKGNLDEVIGMIHVKDVVIQLHKNGKGAGPDTAIEDIVRPVLFVAPSMKLIDLLAMMRAKRTHMAIVVDEYGGTDGLLTIEDLVEQIVGQIEDEHDEDDELMCLTPIEKGVYDAPARLPIAELERVLDCDLLPEKRDEDIDTLGGLVVSLEGSVPPIGSIITHQDGYQFEVLDGDARRITKIRVYNRNGENTEGA